MKNLGGMQRVASDLLDALERSHDAHVRDVLLRASWRWTHVRIVPFMAGLLARLPALAARERADVVLFSSMVTAGLAPALSGRMRKAGVRMAAIAHGRDVTLPNAAYQTWLPHVFGALDAVLPVSLATGDECLVRGLPAAKVYVVPNGIRLQEIEAPAERESARRALRESLPDDAFLLCSAGRQVARKGFAWFVDAVLPRLPERVHYLLAGTGPEEGAIRAAAERHGLHDRVHLLGRVDEAELARLYRGADLFIMPNRPVPGDMEGFGVVLLEAGLRGLYTVAAALEGILDVITEGENGKLVPSGDPAAFARAIEPYLADTALAAADGARAAGFVREHFGWDAVAERYVETLRRI